LAGTRSVSRKIIPSGVCDAGWFLKLLLNVRNRLADPHSFGQWITVKYFFQHEALPRQISGAPTDRRCNSGSRVLASVMVNLSPVDPEAVFSNSIPLPNNASFSNCRSMVPIFAMYSRKGRFSLGIDPKARDLRFSKVVISGKLRLPG
jgi:hypothetical protein